MPGFDGSGPRGSGPLTGGGRGYCAVVLPPGAGMAPYGYAGVQGAPVVGGRALTGAVPWGCRWSVGPRWGRPGAWRGRGRGRRGWR